MSYKGIPEHLLSKLIVDDIESYAIATGWQRVAINKTGVVLLQHESVDEGEILIPKNRGFADYLLRLADAVESIGLVEQRSNLDVINDLLSPSDVVKFRLVSTGTEMGLIGFDEGVNFFNGMRKTLIVSAMDAIEPKIFHPRLQKAEMEQFIENCKLGQTERGSYVASVLCPLSISMIGDSGTGQLGFTEFEDSISAQARRSFGRVVTSRMMLSLERMLTFIDAGKENEFLETEENVHVISSNFFDAIFELQPVGDKSQLSIMASWSSLAPPLGNIPNVINIDQRYFPIFAEIGSMLRPKEQPITDIFVGKVTSLAGQEGDNEVMEGEIGITCLHGDNVIRAKVNLSPLDYANACDAHKLGKYVRLIGTLLRDNGRVYSINDYRDFTVTDYITYGQNVIKAYLQKANSKLR